MLICENFWLSCFMSLKTVPLTRKTTNLLKAKGVPGHKIRSIIGRFVPNARRTYTNISSDSTSYFKSFEIAEHDKKQKKIDLYMNWTRQTVNVDFAHRKCRHKWRKLSIISSLGLNNECTKMYTVGSAWCRILWVAHTELNSYWWSRSTKSTEEKPRTLPLQTRQYDSFPW